MRRGFRPLVMAGIASVLGLSLAVVPAQFSPEQAHAAIAPGLPDPLNVLPSVTKAAAKYGSWDLLGAMLYRGIVSTPTAQAAMATKAGTATVTEAQLVAKMAANFKGMPATAIKGLSKAAGPVGVAVIGADIGMMMGTGAAHLFGLDMSNNALCTVNDSGWNLTAELVSGADCSAFSVPTQEFADQANSDVTARPAGFVSDPVIPVRWGGTGARDAQLRIVSMETNFVNGGVTRGNTWTVTATYSLSGTCVNTGWTPVTASVQGWASATPGVTGTSGGAAAQMFGLGMQHFLGYPNCSPTTGTFTATSNNAPTAATNLRNTHLQFHGSEPNLFSVLWYPPGHPLHTPGVEADPLRTLECRYKFTNGTSAAASSAEFRESDTTLPDIKCPAVPSGLTLEEVSVWEVGGGQEHMLMTEKVTPEFNEVKTNMADCLDGSCILELVKNGVSCMENPEPCADWYEDPNKATNYTCKFGNHNVPLAQCTALAPYYKPGAKTSGAPYGDPDTGAPIPNPAGRAPLPGGVADPEAGNRDCYPSGWGVLNPVEWVLKPVQCALEWAFVPRSSVVNQIATQGGNIMDSTGFGTIPILLNGLSAPFAVAGGGCQGPPWHIEAFGVNETYYPFSACNEPVAGAAALVKGLASFGIVMMSVFACVRYISSIVGFVSFGGAERMTDASPVDSPGPIHLGELRNTSLGLGGGRSRGSIDS